MSDADVELRDYPVRIEVPVAWGDMDALQHVNNTVYFRWFESARIAYFERVGFLETLEEQGVGPILVSTSCQFRKALAHPDTVVVGARVSDPAADRFAMEYAVASRALGAIAALGEGTIFAYDYRRKRRADVPDRVLVAIGELEADAGEV